MDPKTNPSGLSFSPVSPHSWKYDVFLSYKGDDTRNNFTGHLYSSLVQKGIKTVWDEEIGSRFRGEEIAVNLLTSIEESRVSLIILSENYAASSWCLDELVHSLQCRSSKQLMVIPIFYKVEPSEVRHQKGRFGEAFARHELRFRDHNKVREWRHALAEVANLSGWSFSNGGYEPNFIHEIVEDISTRVFNDHTYLNVAKHPIGLDSRVREIIDLLGFEDNESHFHMVGICGNAGIRKTTVAKAVYNSIAHMFEGSCFLANVGVISKTPGGLVQLQKIVLSEILKEKDLEVTNVDKGINMIKRRLREKKVLIVLDDVDKLDQLNCVAGGSDWFGLGSRIIITSRDEHLLLAHQVDEPIYKVKGLNNDEALQLFSSNAFPQSSLSSDYEELANKVVRYAQGLPLALVLLGSLLCGKHVDQWQTILSVLDNKKRVSNEKIIDDLKITYTGIEEWKTALGVLDSNRRVPSIKLEDLVIPYNALVDPMIEDLIQKPLLNVEETRIWMHDMMEEIGEEPHSYRMATSTAWIFLLTNVGLEISSAMFDQFSSPSNNPQGALISMVLAILAVIISIWELIHKGVKERVKYKRQIGMFGWFYSHSGNKIFGSVPDMCGLFGGISQCVYATVQYVCILRHIENPYKIYLWPIIFLLCLGASRLQWNQRNLTRKLKQ